MDPSQALGDRYLKATAHPGGSAGRIEAAPVTTVFAEPAPSTAGCRMLAPGPGGVAAGGGGGVVVAAGGVVAGVC